MASTDREKERVRAATKISRVRGFDRLVATSLVRNHLASALLVGGATSIVVLLGMIGDDPAGAGGSLPIIVLGELALLLGVALTRSDVTLGAFAAAGLTLASSLLVEEGLAWRLAPAAFAFVSLMVLFLHKRGLRNAQGPHLPRKGSTLVGSRGLVRVPLGRSFRILGSKMVLLAGSFLLLSIGWMVDTAKLSKVTLQIAFFAIFLREFLMKRYRLTRRADALAADDLMTWDARRPVLLLRSFIDDSLSSDVSRDDSDRRSLFRSKPVPATYEEEVAAAAVSYGPFIALGRSDESSLRVGAARLTREDPLWRQAFVQLLHDCQGVIVICNKSEGLDWEIRRIVETGALSKTVFLAPRMGPADDVTRRVSHVMGRLGIGADEIRQEPLQRLVAFQRIGDSWNLYQARFPRLIEAHRVALTLAMTNFSEVPEPPAAPLTWRARLARCDVGLLSAVLAVWFLAISLVFGAMAFVGEINDAQLDTALSRLFELAVGWANGLAVCVVAVCWLVSLQSRFASAGEDLEEVFRALGTTLMPAALIATAMAAASVAFGVDSFASFRMGLLNRGTFGATGVSLLLHAALAFGGLAFLFKLRRLARVNLTSVVASSILAAAAVAGALFLSTLAVARSAVGSASAPRIVAPTAEKNVANDSGSNLLGLPSIEADLSSEKLKTMFCREFQVPTVTRDPHSPADPWAEIAENSSKNILIAERLMPEITAWDRAFSTAPPRVIFAMSPDARLAEIVHCVPGQAPALVLLGRELRYRWRQHH